MREVSFERISKLSIAGVIPWVNLEGDTGICAECLDAIPMLLPSGEIT